ncbi:hypothetical protein BJ912DRAFT_489496 [Pholiota molesta]|nr:hypothetical protein BJ912DRAFT_489412 [Pholiota molesta]KAF8185141.1 hypothetical protein BJ912DRAFT_489496 [Pholiota molesta]
MGATARSRSSSFAPKAVSEATRRRRDHTPATENVKGDLRTPQQSQRRDDGVDRLTAALGRQRLVSQGGRGETDGAYDLRTPEQSQPRGDDAGNGMDNSRRALDDSGMRGTRAPVHGCGKTLEVDSRALGSALRDDDDESSSPRSRHRGRLCWVLAADIKRSSVSPPTTANLSGVHALQTPRPDRASDDSKGHSSRRCHRGRRRSPAAAHPPLALSSMTNHRLQRSPSAEYGQHGEDEVRRRV